MISFKEKKPKEKKKKIEDRLKENKVQLQESITFSPPTENFQIIPELLKKHLEITGGMIITRFPPEPNGYLHIGHAKAMSLNFGYAKKLGGKCYMRFDDTNPEVESIEYINSILDNVKWMGYEWCDVTHASDYFDELYELAIQLIKKGHAYVCHQSSEDIKITRDRGTESPWRNRSVEENLREFEKMKLGLYKEGEATLRMKMDMTSTNPCMWDSVAYRIKYVPHPNPKVGDKWCIYPSYDYTHCINDSLENITHSLCTLEFEMRRESYNWLLDALDLYKPVVWEYGRLQLSYTILSKRKLIQLVEGNYGLRGWDDPRLPTIKGLKRKGYTPEAIKNFCEDIGVTRIPGVVIPITKLEEFLREHLNAVVPRAFVVLHPIKLTLVNWTEGHKIIHCPNIPEKDEGTHPVPFCGTLYIERDDFKEEDVEGYFGLALNSNKWIRLKYADVFIHLDTIIKDETGMAIELKCSWSISTDIEPSGNIHWVSEPQPGKEPLKIEVREYERLFLSEDPIKKYKKRVGKRYQSKLS